MEMSFVTKVAKKSRSLGSTAGTDDMGPSQFIGQVADTKAAAHVFTMHPEFTHEDLLVVMRLIRAMWNSGDKRNFTIPDGPFTGGHIMPDDPHPDQEDHFPGDMFRHRKKLVKAKHMPVSRPFNIM